MSIDYYSEHAASFIEDTINIDLKSLYGRFFRYIRQGSLILDAGCGSGRDSKAFLSMGYKVEAFDANAEMAKFASLHTGIDVAVKSFDQVSDMEKYDAIWCCASLLHVQRFELSSIFTKLICSLKCDAVLYFSFKYGDQEYLSNGRYFSNQTEASITVLLNGLQDVELLELWFTFDARPNREDKWLNGIIRKTRG